MNWALQIVFVLVAALIIAGIIWDSRRHRAKNKRHVSRHNTHTREKIVQMPDHEKEEHVFAHEIETHSVADNSFDEVVIVKKKAAPIKQETKQDDIPDEVVAIHVMAFPDQLFKGQDIYSAAQHVNLIYGERKIFHCYENIEGTGSKLFSMASAINPGIFDLDNLDNFTTPGITLFLMQAAPGKAMVAFDMMVRAAKQLAQHLGGQLLDEQYQPLAVTAIEEYRARINAESKRRMRMG
jgi:cell division protein ZipA